MVSTTTLISLIAPLLLATFAPLTTAQGALTCGTTGWDALGATPAFYAIANPATATPAACKKLCATPNLPTKCGSFAVGNGTCLLYAGTVASTLNANTGSQYAYYDAACPTPATLVKMDFSA
ncbi:hypothetical protein B0J14DRAFT_590562 [Halenospora varia]|nr:hypothetical protein B0J14DRAFT_590562 [Halenospora varia]